MRSVRNGEKQTLRAVAQWLDDEAAWLQDLVTGSATLDHTELEDGVRQARHHASDVRRIVDAVAPTPDVEKPDGEPEGAVDVLVNAAKNLNACVRGVIPELLDDGHGDDVEALEIRLDENKVAWSAVEAAARAELAAGREEQQARAIRAEREVRDFTDDFDLAQNVWEGYCTGPDMASVGGALKRLYEIMNRRLSREHAKRRGRTDKAKAELARRGDERTVEVVIPGDACGIEVCWPKRNAGHISSHGSEAPGRYRVHIEGPLPDATEAVAEKVKASRPWRLTEDKFICANCKTLLWPSRTPYSCECGVHLDYVNARELPEGEETEDEA